MLRERESTVGGLVPRLRGEDGLGRDLVPDKLLIVGYCELLLATAGGIIVVLSIGAGSLSAIVKVIIAMGNVVIVAAALTYLLVEGTVMLAESFLKKREEEGRKKGIEQAYRHIAFMIGEQSDLSDAEREKLLELLKHPPNTSRNT